MKKAALLVLRIGMLAAMVALGFLAFFPDWWELRDRQHQAQREQTERASRAEHMAQAQAQRSSQRLLSYPSDVFVDAKFRTCVLAAGKNKPSQISHLDCSHLGIEDVTGLAALTGLRRLDLSHNHLQHLDLSNQRQLTDLRASHNQIKQAILPDQLRIIDLANNRLEQLDLTNASDLITLDISNNRLRQVDIHSTAVESVYADNNRLRVWNLKDPSDLEVVSLRDNQIEVFDLTGAIRLKFLDLSNNPLHALRGVYRQRLQTVLLGGTQLSADVIDALRLLGPQVGTKALLASDFPDPVFRRCVEAHIWDDLAKVTKLTCPRGDPNSLSRGKPIKSTAGIERLFALEQLVLTFHAIESIELGNLLRLKKLSIGGNKLRGLDLRTNHNLQILNAQNNKITEVRWPNQAPLQGVNLSWNQLRTVDLTPVPNLKTLVLRNNGLTGVDLLAQTQLEQLVLDHNKIEFLDLSALPQTAKVSLSNNPISKNNR